MTLNNHAVLNVAVGRAHVLRQNRLRDALDKIGWRGRRCFWTSRFPEGSPPHWGRLWPHPPTMVPYRFKDYAIRVVSKEPIRFILWLDSSIVPVSELGMIWEHVNAHGYLLFDNGWNVGQWCADSALQALRLGRENSFKIPLCVGGAFGLDLQSEIGSSFVTQLRGIHDRAFCGPWDNLESKASTDPRVLGHRHDQTVMSVIAHRLGMTLSQSAWFKYGSVENPPANAILIADGKL